MGLFRSIFKFFKTKNSVDEGVEEVFSSSYKIEKMRNIKSYFPDYPTKIGFFCNYSIFDSTGTLRWVIVILKHNQEKSDFFVQFVEELRKRKIKVIHFYEQFPNEKEYVVNRIRSHM